MEKITIIAPKVLFDVQPIIPSSKSISNRLLILNALSQNPALIQNISVAEDTRILHDLLSTNSYDEYCGDGGTTARFLLALRCAQNHTSIITGSTTLNSRPLKPLLLALEELGAQFEFLQMEYALPLRIVSGIVSGGHCKLRADISSQFISALMLIAPVLKGGLTITLIGKTVSQGYVQSTAALMKLYGVSVQFSGDTIHISEQSYAAMNTAVSADWSSAGYWFAFAACLPASNIFLQDLIADDLQPDQQQVSWMKAFGVTAVEVEGGFSLTSELVNSIIPFQFDFTNCPDLAQTFAVMAAVKGVPLKLTGLSTLKVKETNRISALQQELQKTGVTIFVQDDTMEISGKADPALIANAEFETWNDHRMTMSLALLSCTGAAVVLKNSDNVSKSYPAFFNELKKAGFILR